VRIRAAFESNRGGLGSALGALNLSFLCLIGNLKISAPGIYEQASKVEWKSTNWGWIVDSQSGKPSILAENAGKIKGQADCRVTESGLV